MDIFSGDIFVGSYHSNDPLLMPNRKYLFERQHTALLYTLQNPTQKTVHPHPVKTTGSNISRNYQIGVLAVHLQHAGYHSIIAR
jgi:hypothetical protein